MSKSHYKPRAYGTLKHATTALIEAAGGIAAAAAGCRASSSQIGRYGDPDLPEISMPADVVLDLEARAGVPVVSRYLVEHLGCAVLPALPEGGETDLAADLARLGESTSALFAEFAAALTDEHSPGEVDEAETRRLLERGDQVAAAIMYATARLRATLPAETNGKGGA